MKEGSIGPEFKRWRQRLTTFMKTCPRPTEILLWAERIQEANAEIMNISSGYEDYLKIADSGIVKLVGVGSQRCWYTG